MIRPVTDEEVQALQRLVRTPDGRAFQKLVSAELRAIQDKLLDAPQDKLEALRSRGAALRDLEKLLNDAQQIL